MGTLFSRVFRSALAFGVLALLTVGCSATRAPVPPGTVPAQGELRSADEQYGHEVMSSLMDQFKLDTDDARINRVRGVVEKLTAAGKSDHNPWHVYVFDDDSFKNAAATRGNYIFVWSGVLNSVRSDSELATILAHEIGHVLAGHTEPSPSDEVNEILAGVAGDVAREAVLAQGGGIGLAADLAAVIVTETMKAIIVNPDSQSKELEADHIGLFLMSDAGYNPEEAINFWDRVKNDPDFSGFPLQFLSSHPSSEERLQILRRYLPDALERYRGSTGLAGANGSSADGSDRAERWIVSENWASIYAEPDTASELVIDLPIHTALLVERSGKRWYRVVSPVEGFVRSRELSPASN